MRKTTKKKMKMRMIKATMQNQPMKPILLSDPALGLLKHVTKPLVCQLNHHSRSLKEYSHHLVRMDQLPSHLSNRHSLLLSKELQSNLQHHLLSLADHQHHLLHHLLHRLLLHLESEHLCNLQYKLHHGLHHKLHLNNLHQYLGINNLLMSDDLT